MRLTTVSLALLLFCQGASGQTKTNKPHAPGQQASPQDTCVDIVRDARDEGLLEGMKLGADMQLVLSSTRLSDTEKPLPIRLLVEGFDGSAASQLAAAEVIRTHFSDSLQVVPEAPLYLHINITGTRRTGGLSEVQFVSAEIWAGVKHRFFAGKERHRVLGHFVIAEKGDLLANYTEQRTAQVVREMTYDVISQFLREWQEATEASKD